MGTAVWHGTDAESKALVSAIAHNCTCQSAMGKRVNTCVPHQAMLDDQRFLDGLLWDRHLRDRLLAEEFRRA